MTTLAANIDDSQTLIPISGPLTNGTFQLPLYYTVGSEAIRVTGRAHRTSWLVERGIAGTTAATHSSGATLTRYYPEAAAGEAGPGGALTVTDGVISVEATTLSLTAPAVVTDEGAGVAGADTGIPDPINGDEDDVIQIIGGAYSLGPVPSGFSEEDHDALDHAPVFPVEVIASGASNANGKVSAETVDGAASAGSEAEATGEGNAITSIQAVAATGSADVDVGAQTTEGDVTVSLRATQDAAQAGFIISVTGAGVEQILALGLPTSNPNVAGALWNDTGTLKISAG